MSQERELVGLEAVLYALDDACSAEGTQKAWAKRHGLSASYVSDVSNRRRDPGLSICQALGFDPVMMYRAPAKPRVRKR